MKTETLLLVLLLIVLSSCTNQINYIPECDNQKTQGERDICYNNKAIVNHDFRYCDKISKQEKKEWCITMVEKAVGPRPEEKWLGIF